MWVEFPLECGIFSGQEGKCAIILLREKRCLSALVQLIQQLVRSSEGYH